MYELRDKQNFNDTEQCQNKTMLQICIPVCQVFTIS